MEKVKVLIIGSGPAGYTAAIYASRASLSPVLYEGLEPGGQLTTTTLVENFPGFENGVDANSLMAQMKAQAERFGADIRRGIIESIDLSSRPFRAKDGDGNEIEADSVIIATCATARYLGLPSEQKYRGMGVSACATCDGFFYRKKDVAVVGGGDTACEEATYLANLCNKVYMIVRRDVFRASKAMQETVKNTPNIEILWETQTLGLFGEGGVEGAHLVRGKGTDHEELFDIAIDGFFLAIGHHPNSDVFREVRDNDGNIVKTGVECDEQGYIRVKHPTTETNIPGVFAAGDVADPLYRQAISAAGSGCHAAMDAKSFLA